MTTYEVDLTEVFKGSAIVAHKVSDVLTRDRERFMVEIRQAVNKVVESYLESVTFAIVNKFTGDPIDGPRIILKVTVQ
jgi:hypothetical protein